MMKPCLWAGWWLMHKGTGGQTVCVRSPNPKQGSGPELGLLFSLSRSRKETEYIIRDRTWEEATGNIGDYMLLLPKLDSPNHYLYYLWPLILKVAWCASRGVAHSPFHSGRWTLFSHLFFRIHLKSQVLVLVTWTQPALLSDSFPLR